MVRPQTLLQQYVTVLIAFLFAVAEITVKPYRASVDNFLSSVSSIALVFVLLGILGINTPNLLGTETSNGTTMSLSGTESLLWILGVSSLALLLCFVWILAAAILSSARLPHARWIVDRSIVELAPLPAYSYHAFLSHQWRSGQDQVRTIKEKLLQLVPGISVFLGTTCVLEHCGLDCRLHCSAIPTPQSSDPLHLVICATPSAAVR